VISGGPGASPRIRVEWERYSVPAPVAGVAAWQLETPRVTLALYELDADVDVPTHAHEGDEVGVVLAGSIQVTVEDQSTEMLEGDTFLIPAGKRHSARTVAGRCRLLESYSPKR
jgi:quercetin dioxygenase-like cupin family protein